MCSDNDGKVCFYKLLREDDTHNDLTSQTDLDVDLLPFCTYQLCSLEGIHLTNTESIPDCVYTRKVFSSDDAKLCVESGYKAKANKLILGRKCSSAKCQGCKSMPYRHRLFPSDAEHYR